MENNKKGGVDRSDARDLIRPLNPRFALGRTCITAGAQKALSPGDVALALARHVEGDWGEVDEADCVENCRALMEESRLLSAYRSSKGLRFWIITEWDRSATTVLLPEEY